MKFAKMEGLGNDFVVTCDISEKLYSPQAEMVRHLCDRRLGIGGDGLIVVRHGPNGLGMRIFNCDGSEAEMCGNGIRCIAEYVSQENLSTNSSQEFSTKAGLIKTERLGGGMVRVDMGSPVLDPVRIPTTQAKGLVLKKELKALDRTFEVTAVSMGNPHAVIFTDNITDELVLKYGAALEKHPFFPAKANVEFVTVKSSSEAVMRVWERGCGETPACGTGACAAAVAGALNGLLGTVVTMHLAGGDLKIAWEGGETSHVFMTGPARRVFDGEVKLHD
jgi:diaminopimelate epimerase